MSSVPKTPIRVRLAPSPTGSLHIGTARTALFNWLFAKQNQGQFVLRIEDTDKERSEKKYEVEILEALTWLGLNWNEGPNLESSGDVGTFGPYRQSERIAIYRKYLEKLLAEKKAYYCYCTKEELEAQKQSMASEGLPAKYNGHCRNLTDPPKNKEPQVIRFLTPEKRVEFVDLIRGKVSFDSSLFGDMVIAKDAENPLYNFAVVIDDEEMAISHVIRGEDHLSNTPKQILMQEALGFKNPTYGHLPLILAADRSKLSKRYAETSLLEYRKNGYLPEAVLNFMALLGWHPEGDDEVLTPEQMIEKFDIKKIQKSGAIFNPEKLAWLNSQHIKILSNEKILDIIRPNLEKENIQADKEFILKIIGIEKNRLKNLADFIPQTDFFFRLPDYETKLLKWKDETLPDVEINLSRAKKALEAIDPKNFTSENIKTGLEAIVDPKSRGQIYWPLRAALSGKQASPDPIEIAAILGQTETITRIQTAISKINTPRENHYAQTT